MQAMTWSRPSLLLLALACLLAGMPAHARPAPQAANSRRLLKTQGICPKGSFAPPSSKCWTDSKSYDPAYGYCTSNLQLSCADAVNTPCDSCYLWHQVSDPAGPCKTGQSSHCTHDSGLNFLRSDGPNHWLVVPSWGIEGIEKVLTTPKGLGTMWQQGWEKALAGALPGQAAKMGAHHTALAINYPHARTQHQMHVHVAGVHADFQRDFLTTAGTSLVASAGQWVPDASGKTWRMFTPTFVDPFKAYREAMVSQQPKWNHDVLHTGLAMGAATDKYGYVIVLFTGMGDHQVLCYRDTTHCA